MIKQIYCFIFALGIYCGNTIPTNITGTESLWIQFKSSDIGTAKGFMAEYNLGLGVLL